jgi:hypothetical protein
MSNKNLFQEAIADAKAVREAALANAKAALEESMTPRLQSMIAAKLEENYDELEEDELGEGMYPEDTSDEIQDRYRATGAALEEEDGLDEELDLSAILAELDAESQLEEAKDKKKKEDEETEDEEAPEEGNEEEAEPTKVKDMTDEELIDLIKSIVQQEIEAEEEETPEDEAGEPEHGGMDMNPMGAEQPVGNEEEINIDELLAELDALEEGSEDEEKESVKEEKEESASKKEMKEAIRTIQTLRNELNEVNLLNAKLLYVNKIFKSKNLSEAQKLQVITSFDKATTTNEAKVVFESLSTALTPAKKQIKESIGFASKAAGIAPRKQQIVESDDAITRMQKLANIIK